jgi:speckle-type POZ protein
MGSNLAVPSNANSSSSSSIQPVPTTARVESRCIPRTAQGTLSFEVTGYRQVLKVFAKRYISSSSIEVGGYSWCLQYYPDGDSREQSNGFVGVYLELLTKNVDVKALYEFRLVDLTTAGAPPSVIYQLQVPRTFNTVDASTNQHAFGLISNKYLKRSELEASVYLRDDRLVIECEFIVFNEPLVVETKRTTTVVDTLHRNLSLDFANLLESKEGADVTFEVQGEVVPAHTVVLAARSPVFKAQFYGPLKEEIGESHVTVHDMQPAVFKALLYFIYADAMSPSIDGLDEKEELTKHLLVAGDRYDVQGLRSLCETKLCENLDVSTVATTLAFADQNHCEKLKDACIEFMVSNIKLEDLFASNGYEDLKSSCPAVFIDLYERKARASKI